MGYTSILIVAAMVVAVAVAKHLGSTRRSKQYLGKKLPGPKGVPCDVSSAMYKC